MIKKYDWMIIKKIDTKRKFLSLSIFFDEIYEIEKTMIDNVNLFYEEQTEFIFWFFQKYSKVIVGTETIQNTDTILENWQYDL